MFKQIAVIIVYNNLLSQANTCDSIKDNNNIIIWDNSLESYRYENKNIADSRGWVYLSQHKNVGLSVAYNEVIKYCQEHYGEYYLTIFDDDSTIPANFLSEIRSTIINDNYPDIVLPIVRDTKGVLSPSLMAFGLYPIRLKNAKSNTVRRITAINTGMTISSKVFERFKYNEKMFVDYIDHYFMRYARENDLHITIANKAVIEQQFSETTIVPEAISVNRFKIYIKDYIAFSNRKRAAIILLFLRALRKSLKYKSISFMQVLIKEL